MILLKKIKLIDFLSHKDTEISFNKIEKILIDGPSGAGKSSIIDALVWNLYGIGRSDNRSLVRRGAKKASIRLELLRKIDQKGEEDIVVVTRTVTSAGKHTLEIAFQQGSSLVAHPLSGIRELQNWIEKDLIGASYLLFVNSIAYVQGNLESFVSQTAPKRKELLLEIAKTEDYDKHYENSRQTLSRLENDSNKLSGQVLELESRLEAIRGHIGDRSVYIKTITDNTKSLSDIDLLILSLEDKKVKYLATAQAIDVLEASLKTCVLTLNSLQSTIVGKKAKISNKPEMVALISTLPSHQESLDNLTAKLKKLRGTLVINTEQEAKRNEVLGRKPIIHDRTAEETRITNNIAKIESEPVCPSGINCPYSGDHKKQVDDLMAQRGVIRESLITETTLFSKWSEEVNNLPPSVNTFSLITEINELENKVDEAKGILARISSTQKEIDSLAEVETEIPILEKSLEEKDKEIIALESKIKETNESIKAYQGESVATELARAVKERDSLKESIARATIALETIGKEEEEIKVIETRISGIKNKESSDIQEKIRKVELIKEAFGPKGIRVMVIDYLLSSLEDKVNKILSQLSDFRIRFDTQRKSADGESTIEGLYINIVNEMGEEMSYESYSGGEKIRITFALSEAFASLGHNKIGFRLIDEAVLALDPNSLESFMEVVQTLLSDFSQVLFISHIQDIKDLFEHSIEVTKKDGTSEIKRL